MAHIHINHITYSYGATTIVEDLSCQFHPGWTGIAGVNGAGKTTILKLAAGILKPQTGYVSGPERRLYLPQLPDTSTEGLEEFFYDWDPPAAGLKEILRIRFERLFRLNTLSCGELKRLQVGRCL